MHSGKKGNHDKNNVTARQNDDSRVKELESALKELEKKAAERDEYFDKCARAQADYDNARKRMEKDMRDSVKYANESLIGELFPILDSFDGAMAALEKREEDKGVLDGLKMIQSKFHKVLESNGLSVVKTVGEKFDPVMHEAVMKIHDDKFGDGVVAEELRKGYTLYGKVLRPAMVKVSVKDEKSDEKGEGVS